MAFAEAQNFRKAVNENPVLTEEFRKLMQSGSAFDEAHLISFAEKHGFQLSATDFADIWEDMLVEGDLSDLELELVSAGGQAGSNTPPATAPPRGQS